jgi:hypothetical protein
MSKQLAEQATTPASLRWRDLIRRKDDGAAEIHRPAQANLRTIAPGDEASETVNSMSSGSVPRFRRVRLTFAALRRCQMHDGAGDGGGDDGDGDAGNGPRRVLGRPPAKIIVQDAVPTRQCRPRH